MHRRVAAATAAQAGECARIESVRSRARRRHDALRLSYGLIAAPTHCRHQLHTTRETLGLSSERRGNAAMTTRAVFEGSVSPPSAATGCNSCACSDRCTGLRPNIHELGDLRGKQFVSRCWRGVRSASFILSASSGGLRPHAPSGLLAEMLVMIDGAKHPLRRRFCDPARRACQRVARELAKVLPEHSWANAAYVLSGAGAVANAHCCNTDAHRNSQSRLAFTRPCTGGRCSETLPPFWRNAMRPALSPSSDRRAPN
jgi:hypothetical protein